MESLIEMQILTGIAVLVVTKNFKIEKVEGSDHIIIALLCEHVFAYISTLFRAWEIDHHGKMDVNGIIRGPKESILKSFEVFVDCLIVGYSAHFILTLDDE